MKNLFIAILIVLLGFQVSAQKFGGGLEIGTGFSWLNTDSKNASVESGKIGFTYGAFLDINLTDNFCFTTGVNLNYVGGSVIYKDAIQLRWDEVEHNIMAGSEVSYKIQYVEVPISIKGKTQEIGYITYFGRLGAQPSIAVKSRADIDGIAMKGVEKVTDLEGLNVKENINLFNVGWHVGGGIEYSLGGSTSLIAEALFTQNFISMTKDNITDKTGNHMSITNSMVMVKVGIKF